MDSASQECYWHLPVQEGDGLILCHLNGHLTGGFSLPAHAQGMPAFILCLCGCHMRTPGFTLKCVVPSEATLSLEETGMEILSDSILPC